MSIYHVIRRLHLFTGLVLLGFVLMYFATGWVMIHERWFPRAKPAVIERTETLPGGWVGTDEQLAAHLQEQFGLRGKRTPPKRRGDGSILVAFAHPGTTTEALVSKDGRTLKLTTKRAGAAAVAHGLHRLHGYGGGAFYWIWALLYDLASVALILFAVTGVVLWYQSTSQHAAGWICLGLSSAFAVGTILYFMYRP